MHRLLTIALGLLVLAGCDQQDSVLRIGSKDFTEQRILAEMMAQLADAQGIPVERHIPYGDTFLVQEALKAGDLDLYPEYNGTGLILLGQPPIADGDQSYEEVKGLFEPLGLVWGPRFGFSNDYAIAMRADHATARGVDEISDLTEFEGGIDFVTDADFLDRPLDGLDAMVRRYGLIKGETIVFPVTDKEQIYQTLLDGEVDVAEVFTTDGHIDDYGLALLEDDLSFFPIYQPAPLARADALATFPALQNVFDQLAGAISEPEMREMNRLVDTQGQTYQMVAQNFLVEAGLLTAAEAAPVPHAEPLLLAVAPLAELGEATLRAVRAAREVFPQRDIQVVREADPLQAIVEGRARLAVAGADEFFDLTDGPYPAVENRVEALGVIKYRFGHLITKADSPAQTISDLERVGVGPPDSTSDHTARMLLDGLGLADQIELVTNDDVDAITAGLEQDEVDALFLMSEVKQAQLQAFMSSGDYRLLPLSEWKEGNSMLRFPFLRLAQIPADSYDGQTEPVETISAQVVLAGPAPGARDNLGETGPGFIPGVVQSLPLPVPASVTLELAAALGSGERVDPKIPTAAALAPQRPAPPPPITVAPTVSVTNLLAILFICYMLYLFVREERQH